jgi:hypothetical protein
MGILSPHYNSSFDGTSFWEQSASGFYSQRPITTTGGPQKQPASDTATFDDQGEGAEPFELEVGVDGAEYAALLAKRGDNGTLAYSGGSVTCTLIAVIDQPGKAGALDAYKIRLRFQPGADVYRPQLALQVDTATFPSSSVVDITPYLLGFDVDLGTDTDNGSASLTLRSLPGDADEGNRIYIYGDGTLLFSGFLPDGGTAWAEDGTVTLSCVDALFKLRLPYGGVDRTYDSGSGDTDTNVAQNVVEAAGVDVSLTSIQGEDRPIGTAQDVVIRGAGVDISGAPSAADSLMEFIRLLDKSVIPNHATFTRANGAVYRRAREIGSSVATFTTSNAWGFSRRREPGSIINKWLVKGLTIADVPTEAEASDSNSLLVAPWEYNGAELSSYLVDDPTWAQDLADWLLGDTNGRLNVVSWITTLNNQTDILGSTVTVTSSRHALSSQLVYVTSVRHHAEQRTATSSFTAIFRD